MIEKLARYRILEKLGEGTLGAVYKAADDILGGTVAIRTIPESIRWTPDEKSRFHAEYKSIVALQHPNIVSVHNFGEAEGTTYVVMELLQGKNLRTILIDKIPLSLEDKFSIVVQIVEGFKHAHRSGILHRDVKPSKVYLEPDGTVKILDFGIAHLLRPYLARPSVRWGTPIYLSPEQVQGRVYDERSDIFSAGIVFAELITGAHPFHDKDSNRALDNILFKSFQPTLEQFPDTPPGMFSILSTCLEKDPLNRYKSMTDLESDCGEVLEEIAEDSEFMQIELQMALPRLKKAVARPRASPALSELLKAIQSLVNSEERTDYASLNKLMRALCEHYPVIKAASRFPAQGKLAETSNPDMDGDGDMCEAPPQANPHQESCAGAPQQEDAGYPEGQAPSRPPAADQRPAQTISAAFDRDHPCEAADLSQMELTQLKLDAAPIPTPAVPLEAAQFKTKPVAELFESSMTGEVAPLIPKQEKQASPHPWIPSVTEGERDRSSARAPQPQVSASPEFPWSSLQGIAIPSHPEARQPHEKDHIPSGPKPESKPVGNGEPTAPKAPGSLTDPSAHDNHKVPTAQAVKRAERAPLVPSRKVEGPRREDSRNHALENSNPARPQSPADADSRSLQVERVVMQPPASAAPAAKGAGSEPKTVHSTSNTAEQSEDREESSRPDSSESDSRWESDTIPPSRTRGEIVKYAIWTCVIILVLSLLINVAYKIRGAFSFAGRGSEVESSGAKPKIPPQPAADGTGAARTGGEKATADVLLREAQKLAREGRFEEGKVLLRRILEISPSYRPAIVALAQFNEESAAQMSGRRDSEVRTLLASASSLIRTGNLQEAKAKLDRAEQLHPNLPQTASVRRRWEAKSSERFRDLAKKEAELESARALTAEQARNRQLEEVYRQGKYPEAQGLLDQWLADNPKSSQAREWRMRTGEAQRILQSFDAAFNGRKYPDALNAIARLEQLNPSDPGIPELRRQVEARKVVAKASLTVHRLGEAAMLTLDGVPLGKNGEAENESVAIGNHAIAVSGKNGYHLEKTLDFSDGQRVALVYDTVRPVLRSMSDADRESVKKRRLMEQVHRVAVEHYHGVFRGNCKGELLVSSLEVQYESKTGSHGFRMPFRDLKLRTRGRSIDLYYALDGKEFQAFKASDENDAKNLKALWDNLESLSK